MPNQEAPQAARDIASRQAGSGRSSEGIIKAMEQKQNGLEGLVTGNLEEVEAAINSLTKLCDADLLAELGKLAQNLNAGLRELKQVIAPRMKQITEHEMPEAADRLDYVLKMTDRAANTTLGICEQKFQEHEELDAGIAELGRLLDELRSSPRRRRAKVDAFLARVESLKGFLGDFSTRSQHELTEIVMAQAFQDLTGQILQKVLSLLNELETNLASLVKRFGVSTAAVSADEETSLQAPTFNGGPSRQGVKQDEVDSLLAGFGF
ncbi:MAG: protein phosphatase CheZ [Candidatus Tectomicrobia bacterium]|nr:protein phosphatase CheZ [Candidatus Tectomicrobia bacterium]